MGKKKFFICGVLLLSGCISPAVSPHQNFIGHLNAQIGTDIDEVPHYQIPHPKDLISSKKRPNENIENEYKFSGSCRYFYEINPETRKIIGARYEGNNIDCSIIP